MFKNRKTGIIIFAIFVVALIMFFPNLGNSKEYKDTNGEDNYSLCKITDEDIIEGMDSSTLNIVTFDEVKNEYWYLGKLFNGSTTLGTANPLTSSDTIEIQKFSVTKGNARLLILADDKIVHDFIPNESGQNFSLNNLEGEISLVVAGESANFEVVFKVIS
ncbi:MAG: hypothetical protein E7556_03745 [Ruminococcaceae bacterium]|nr:hypothetical protein [Oscillospiraceae bacterium]